MDPVSRKKKAYKTDRFHWISIVTCTEKRS